MTQSTSSDNSNAPNEDRFELDNDQITSYVTLNASKFLNEDREEQPKAYRMLESLLGDFVIRGVDPVNYMKD